MVNAGMLEYWNGDPGRFWAAKAERFDAILAPFGRRLLAAAGIQHGERVLDVGCGNGTVSLKAARAAGPEGSVTGLDLSAPMLEVARRRADEEGLPVQFVQGDGQTTSFDGSFDIVVSRFGVMFFDDPAAAFANLAKAVRPGGRLCFVCWQEMLANEWIAVLALAMVPHVGIPELPDAGAPGPFAFADAARTQAFLASAGWSETAVEPFVEDMAMGSDPEDVLGFMLSDEMGRRLVEGRDPLTVEAAKQAALEALGPHVTAHGVSMRGAAWLVTARKR
jgi:ubiquinone/menaquinone biosynthesis C-methylase UbiE